ncbi:hypothetical protein [Nonomuraea sp. NPDC049784]|uniref:hypothetical protein n=1 Tax=Nonomuraea sp. NPDC049784 TaxID=3154361 RepID=UPI0033F19931
MVPWLPTFLTALAGSRNSCALLILGHARHLGGDHRSARRNWQQAHELFTAIGTPEAHLTASLLK